LNVLGEFKIFRLEVPFFLGPQPVKIYVTIINEKRCLPFETLSRLASSYPRQLLPSDLDLVPEDFIIASSALQSLNKFDDDLLDAAS
jgi:hypothetical protein